MPTFPQLGQRISHSDAEIMFKRLMAIKDRSVKKIREALKDDDEALRYYCGRPDAKVPEWQDIAFFFDLDTLRHINQRIADFEGDGMVIFSAARAKEDSEDDFNGRPTAIVLPYKKIKSAPQESANSQNAMLDDESYEVSSGDGDQHPGSGFKGQDGTTMKVTDLDLPSRFKVDEVRKFQLKLI